MRRLFFLECKKLVKSVTYWLFVAAMAVVFWMNYGNVDKEEIDNASSPSSVFFHAKDGQYAVQKPDLSEKSEQNKMMLGLTGRLLQSYRNNSYEYYPYDFIKEKVFSETEQKIVLRYLQEITGLDKDALQKDTEKTSDSSEVEISGEGQYVAKPGAGHMNEAGQYEFSPDDWEYIENSSDSKETTNDGEAENFTIQVSFQRFMEIMDEISCMIGKNSYFSRALINLYYGDNDMEDSPVTLKQHEEFYDKDKISGAFARYYCDSIALAVLLLPVFVISAMMAGDRRNKLMEPIFSKPVSGFRLLVVRYLAAITMMLVPVLCFPVKSFIVLAGYAKIAGCAIDILAFPKYIMGWILPTLLFVAALSLFLNVLTRSSISVLGVGIFWIFFKPSVGKIAGANYELFDIVIRHNTLKGFGRMTQHLDMLIINRIFITGISLLLVLLSIWIYHVKRTGGLRIHVPEFIHYHKREL